LVGVGGFVIWVFSSALCNLKGLCVRLCAAGVVGFWVG